VFIGPEGGARRSGKVSQPPKAKLGVRDRNVPSLSRSAPSALLLSSSSSLQEISSSITNLNCSYTATMASRAITRLPLVSSRGCFELLSASRRTFITSRAGLRLRPLAQTTTSKSILQQTIRRSYAEAAAPPPPPPPPPKVAPPKLKKRFRFFRWVWRFTYLSALGAAGWLTYHIYVLRHPVEQFDVDSSKKTLVILGMDCLPPDRLMN